MTMAGLLATAYIPSSGASSLYAFTTATFTNASATGENGPTLAQCQTAYTGTTWIGSYFTMSTQGYQVWTIPKTGTYEIEIAGARSGEGTYSSTGTSYGKGAILRARYSLTQGQTLTMVVGQFANLASGGSYNGAGGGGGTFVVHNGSLLMAAGGGGASGAYSGYAGGANQIGQNAVTTTSGGSSYRGASGGSSGAGGNQGAVASNYKAGSGAGHTGNGRNGAGSIANSSDGSYGGGGQAYNNSAIGGVRSSSFPSESTPGGFGGGGGGSPISGGGGGGYSGGGGSYHGSSTESDGGGGGGSYLLTGGTNIATSNGLYAGSNLFDGISITNIGSYRDDMGYVSVTAL